MKHCQRLLPRCRRKSVSTTLHRASAVSALRGAEHRDVTRAMAGAVRLRSATGGAGESMSAWHGASHRLNRRPHHRGADRTA